MDRRKKYYLVVDTETANIIDDPLVYDIGFAVIDKKGNIYEERSLMLKELFFDMKDVLKSAYYAEKLSKYWEDYERQDGSRELVNIYQARRFVRDTMQKYNIIDVFAYNMFFDRNALDTTLRYLTKSKCRWFFPYGTRFHCIWNMATQTICQQKCYFNKAHELNWVSVKGNLLTNAEKVFSYIAGQDNFAEEHQGLDDVRIEAQILTKVLRQHKSIDTSINRNCWQIPQKAWREYLENIPSKKLKMICFDMDGTIADLYNVTNWEAGLNNSKVEPYAEAVPMWDMDELSDVLNALKAKGIEIRIISWGAMNGSKEYLKRTKATKQEWLDAYNFPYDKIHCTQYGTSKNKSIRKSIDERVEEALLIDDSEKVRKSWRYGNTIDPTTTNIIDELKALCATL